MNKDKNYWQPVFEEFLSKYPEAAKNIVDWYPSAQMEITIKLKDGRKYSYDWLDKILRIVYDPEQQEEMSEMEWRNILSKNMLRKMKHTGISQYDLSYITGISQVTISRYINSKATPSTYNIRKIARAFKCSVSELISV